MLINEIDKCFSYIFLAVFPSKSGNIFRFPIWLCFQFTVVCCESLTFIDSATLRISLSISMR